ncbi:hypothetical protein [Brevundimonas sp.]|jgi:hypothetical protein|uniref:hypothetical protein n=1 Tax=Brevundimonas sp. TaxID=1871086 RepID=UPI002E13FBD9|nr:hypothetical protein [Brevundimonas sp.]
MSRKFALAAAVAASIGLAFALPAAAAPIAAAVLAQDPITEADIEAKAEAFGASMEALGEQVGAIRADASLSDADKSARIDAAIAARQPEIDAFVGLITAFIDQEVEAGNIPADQADGIKTMVAAQFAQIPQAMKTGDFSGMGQMGN